MFPMTRAEIDPAPRWRRMLAGAVDAAIGGGVVWLSRRRLSGIDGRTKRLMRLFGPTSEFVHEQLGSPGEWIMGVRTVDSRTGRRVALGRTLVLVLARVVVDEIQRNVSGVPSPIPMARHAELARERQAIMDAHPDDPDARNHAMRRLYKERQADFAGGQSVGWRMLAGIVGGVAVNRWARRRLAPTVDVVSRERGRDHNP
jgi:hypothetical protein